MKWLETHKHLAICIACLLGVGIIANGIERHRERIADKNQDGMKAVLAQKDRDIAARDRDFQSFRDDVLKQIEGIKTARQAVTVLQPIMQGATPAEIKKSDLPVEAQKNIEGPPDTHLNVLTDEQIKNLAKDEKQCEIDRKGLSTCEENRITMQQKIDALTEQNQRWEDAGTVPRWTAMLGVSKTRDGGYKPAALLSYRITHHTGLAFGSVNNSLVAGINIHFGGKPK